MSVITRETKVGRLFVDLKTNKLLMNTEAGIVDDTSIIYELLEENRIPIKVDFEITGNCNLNCYYCYAKSIRNKDSMSTDNIKDLIDLFERIGIIYVELTGGEVLIREDIIEILKYLGDKDFITTIMTNLTLINDDIANQLVKLKKVHVQTSLLAPNRELCDSLTGVKGSFNKIIDGINILKKFDISCGITVCITNKNIHMFDKFKELEVRLDVPFKYCLDVDPTYTGFDQVKEYSLDKNYKKTIKHIFLKDKTAVERSINRYRCGAATSKFSVDHNGGLMPCFKYRTIIGSLINEDFEYIWNSKSLKRIVSNEISRPEKCKLCENKKYCVFCPGINNSINLSNKNAEDSNSICRKAILISECME